jgi:hypothetical protein
MRAIFVNYSHPDFPHVSSMRVRYFADTLACQGNKIVLLTKTLRNDELPKTPKQVAEELISHDWGIPYHLACKPIRNPWLDSVRNNRLPIPLGKAMVAWYLWCKHGVFSDWVDSTRQYWKVLMNIFRPEVTWGSFGNTSVLEITRELAKQMGAPWVVDIKDDWQNGVPDLLQVLLARRFSDAAALTVNSRFLQRRSAKWFPYEATVIYSGVPQEAITELEGIDCDGKFCIVMVGGSGEKMGLLPFLSGLRFWFEKAGFNANERAKFIYAGNDHPIVRKAAKVLEDVCDINIYSYLPVEKMLQLCKAASVNVYVWNPIGFHHKIVELLCCRRPVIAFPGENNEAVELAASVRGKLYICTNQFDLASVLNEIRSISSQGLRFGDLDLLKNFTWDAQSSKLYNVLNSVIAGK